jgi:hypothetical protein
MIPKTNEGYSEKYTKMAAKINFFAYLMGT